MSQLAVQQAGGVAYREAGPTHTSDHLPMLCLHGWPQSSYMWRHLLPALASAGHRVLAPDLPGFGDSPPDRPGTWARHVEAVERFRREIGLDRVILVVHDTGGGIGLRWACDHPDAVSGMVITNTGFFPDYGVARTREGDADPRARVRRSSTVSRAMGSPTLLEAASSAFDARAIDEYWKAFSTTGIGGAMLELYRSFDVDELAPYEGEARGPRGAHTRPLGRGG